MPALSRSGVLDTKETLEYKPNTDDEGSKSNPSEPEPAQTVVGLAPYCLVRMLIP